MGGAVAFPSAHPLIVGQYGSAQIFGGRLLGANFNSTADQAISINLPSGFTRWRPNAIFVVGASVNLTTAVGGVYPSASKAGTAIVASTQVYTTLTGAADNASGSVMTMTLAATATLTRYDLTTIYFSLTTGQGSAATADIYVSVTPLL